MPGLKLLLVDDNATMEERLLRQVGLPESWLVRDSEGNVPAGPGVYGLVLLNADFQKTFAICRRLKKARDTATMPVAFFSASAERERLKVLAEHRSLPTHADYYLLPPLEDERLRALVEKHVGVLPLDTPAGPPVQELPLEMQLGLGEPAEEIAFAPPPAPPPVTQRPPEPPAPDVGPAVQPVSSVEDAIGRLQREFSQIQAQFASRLSSAEQQKSEAQDRWEAQVNSLASQRDEALERVGTLEQELAEARREAGEMSLRALEGEGRVAKSEVDQVRTELALALEKMRDQESLFKRLEDSYRGELEARDATIRRLLERVERGNSRVTALARLAPELEGAVGRLQGLVPLLGEVHALLAEPDEPEDVGLDVAAEPNTDTGVERPPDVDDDFLG
jgi:CheY-like chemotaxis protein